MMKILVFFFLPEPLHFTRELPRDILQRELVEEGREREECHTYSRPDIILVEELLNMSYS